METLKLNKNQKKQKTQHTKQMNLTLNPQNKKPVYTFICEGKGLGISTSASHLDNTMA